MLDALCKLVADFRGAAAASDRSKIQKILDDHALTEAPQWMIDFVTDISGGRATDHLLRIPIEYPLGEGGLINVLLDIDDELVPLNMDDYGEDMNWPIPHHNVIVYIGRETGGDYHNAAIRPADVDMNEWLSMESQRADAEPPSRDIATSQLNVSGQEQPTSSDEIILLKSLSERAVTAIDHDWVVFAIADRGWWHCLREAKIGWHCCFGSVRLPGSCDHELPITSRA